MVAVYITEAHSQDEWPISSSRFTPDRAPVIVNQPQSSQQRLELACHFREKWGLQVLMLVDPIENPFMEAYTPWPLRFYVIMDGSCVLKAQPKDCSYDLGLVRRKVLQLIDGAD